MSIVRRLFFVPLFFFLLVGISDAVAPPLPATTATTTAKSRWVLLSLASLFHHDDEQPKAAVELVISGERLFPSTECRQDEDTLDESSASSSSKLIQVRALQLGGGVLCKVVLLDPRQMHQDAHAHGQEDEGNHHHHAAPAQDPTIAFRVPLEATSLKVSLPEFEIMVHDEDVHQQPTAAPLMARYPKVDVVIDDIQHPHKKNKNNSRKLAGQVDELVTVSITTTQLEVSTIQVVAPPSQTMNLVFISSGYYGNDNRGYYERDVREAMNFLNGTSTLDTTTSSVPFSTYFQNLNVWRIWHSSDVVGAGDGNNLGCRFGDVDPESLACNTVAAQLVASQAPPDPSRTLIIVLVKEARVGGSGVSRIAVVSAEQPHVYGSLMHQIGHAWASLSNEYVMTTLREPRIVPMKNCHHMSYNTPWQGFTDARVVPESKLGCTFPNYFGPVNGECAMASIAKPALCPVCQYFTLAAMYDNGIALHGPVYPLTNERVYTRPNVPVALFINPYLPYAKRSDGRWAFSTLWTLGAAQTQIGWQQHRVDFSSATPGDYIINVTMIDQSTILLDSQRQYYHNRGRNGPTATTQIISFRVTVSANLPCVEQNTPYGTTYCAVCDPGTQCSYTYTASNARTSGTYEVANLAGLENWMIAIGVVFVVVGILIFVIAWRIMTVHQEHNPSEILPLTDNILRVRMVLIVSQVLVLVMATFCIIYCVYQYNLLTIFGQAIVLGVIACAVVVWFGSYLGIIAAFYKSRGLLFVNFILLLLLFGCVLLFSVLLLYVQTNVTSDGVVEQLQSEWETAVKDRPADVCRYESHQQCSGFSYSCSSIFRNQMTTGSTYCPPGCVSNNYTDACIIRIQDFVKENFGLASIGGWILTALLLLSLVLSVLLGCAIKNRRNTVHRERRIRHATGQNILLPEEIDMLRKEFNKIDKDGSGDISREEFSLFYNAVMGTDLSPRELEEYFDKLDADGNGNLSFEEFLKVYVPHREPRRKSMVKPKSVALQDSSSSEEEAELVEQKPAPGPPPPKDRKNVYAMDNSPPPRSGHLGDVSTSGGAALQPSQQQRGRTPQATPRSSRLATPQQQPMQNYRGGGTSQPSSLNTSTQQGKGGQPNSLNVSQQPAGGRGGNLNQSNMSARSGASSQQPYQPPQRQAPQSLTSSGGWGGGAFEDGLDLDVDLDDDFS